TPLKDGMNLVAKEFCAAQADERGVLIVSEFAGAASELRHGAILVNPNDFSDVAQALHTAAKMPPEEKRSRMQLLRQIVKDHNVQRWTRSFLQAASTVPSPALVPGSGSGSTPTVAAAAPSLHTPGVALVASSVPSPAILNARLAWRHRASRPLGLASGDD